MSLATLSYSSRATAPWRAPLLQGRGRALNPIRARRIPALCYVLLNQDSIGAETQPVRRHFWDSRGCCPGDWRQTKSQLPGARASVEDARAPRRLAPRHSIRPFAHCIVLANLHPRPEPLRNITLGDSVPDRIERRVALAPPLSDRLRAALVPTRLRLSRRLRPTPKVGLSTPKPASRTIAKPLVNCPVPCPVGMFTQYIHLLTTLSLTTHGS